MKKIFLIISVFFFAFQACFAQMSSTGLHIGSPAPAIKASWIKGTPVYEFEKGKVYVMEFWATWCLPCIAGMPHLSVIARTYKEAVTVTGISVFERPQTSFDKIKAFVDSMGNRMDYNVAADDSDYIGSNWITASGERGIPLSFVINQGGKIAWIGHPKYLDSVLPYVVNNTWSITEAAATRKENKEIAKLDNAVIPTLNKYLTVDKADSALIIIKDLVANHPKLEFAPTLAHYTFFALLKTDPQKAYIYGKKVMKTFTYADPPYHSITDGVYWAINHGKIPLPPEVYELGAEAYEAQIENYPWSMDIPVTYDQMAAWYFLANDKTKALNAQEKAINAAKLNDKIPEEKLAEYESHLRKYINM